VHDDTDREVTEQVGVVVVLNATVEGIVKSK
jgi:hypothetical protein